jgi:hypothetical protein
MRARKPHASPLLGMNSIVVSESLSTTFEETYNELLNCVDLLESLLLQFKSIKEDKKRIHYGSERETSRGSKNA